MEDKQARFHKSVFIVPLLLILLSFGLGQTRQLAIVRADARPNVILIVVDALRADHVSAYGYERPTSPNLDVFMSGGVRSAEATSSSSWTFPSNVAMLTGRMPQRIRMNDWGSYSTVVPQEETLLGEALKNGGYRTAGFRLPTDFIFLPSVQRH